MVRPDEKLVKDTYAFSTKHRVPVYDAIFVALALGLGLELKIFDNRQVEILSREKHSNTSKQARANETYLGQRFYDFLSR